MLTELEQKAADFIRAERLLSTDKKVLLAVSGGADSTALLYVMANLKAEGLLPVEICCAHINHQLRGDEAQRDQDFVVEQCRKLNLSVITQKIDVRGYAKAEKLSIETAARQLRIDALLEIAQTQNCAFIATAHQKNDNAETILYRLSRGTGFRGLCGIWPVKEFAAGIRFIRPLLCATRDEIIQYLNSRNLNWCIDSTNEDFAYRRNFIRHRLIPALAAGSQGDIIERLAALANTCRGFYRLICEKADAIWPNAATADKQTVTLDLDKLSAQPMEVRIELVRRALAHLAGGERDITEQHYENVLQLSDGSSLQFPGGIDVHRCQSEIFFTCRMNKEKNKPDVTKSVALKVSGRTLFGFYTIDADVFEIEKSQFEEFKKNKTNLVEWFDFDRLKLPLEVRFRRPGDRFRPLGLPGEKKVGKFLTGAKLSSTLRRKLLIIADSEKIIWLCPARISEQAKVTGRTQKVLQLQVVENQQ